MFAMLLAAVLGGCATKSNVRDHVGLALPETRGRVVVAPAVFLHNVEATSDDLARFRSSTWVGSIWFGGGYEVMPEEEYQIRSVDVVLQDDEQYEAQVAQWAVGAMEEAARDAGWQVVPYRGDPPQVSPPERRNLRGTVSFDGDDNLNLPRFDLVPSSDPIAPVQGVDGVLVPTVVHYYAHNAGWFIGQAGGTWAGARLRLLWSLYDSEGALVSWGEVGTKSSEERLATPNRQQLQDALLEAEGVATSLLKGQFLRE